MTREQREEALQAVQLLALPCQNISDIAYKLVCSIAHGAMNPQESQLIITPQVVTGLSSLQSAVSDLSRAYLAHTNTVLGKGSGTSLDQLSFQNPLTVDNGLFGARGPTPAPTTETGDGKKRKRAPHDKNAPKRALTPFFLYLQTARPLIAKQMGDKHTAKEVQDEGGKRWREMPSEEREVGLPVIEASRGGPKLTSNFRNGLKSTELTSRATRSTRKHTRQASQFQKSVTQRPRNCTRRRRRRAKSQRRLISTLKVRVILPMRPPRKMSLLSPTKLPRQSLLQRNRR